MSDEIPQPGDRAAVEDDGFLAFRRRRRLWMLGGLAGLLIAGGVGYEVYQAYYQLDLLISQVKDCPISNKGAPADRCTGAMEKLIGRLPKECPRVLTAMRKTRNLHARNRLLWALLESRSRRNTQNIVNRAAVRGNSCIEEALLLVVRSSDRPPDRSASSRTVGGITEYCYGRLATKPNWGLRLRLLSKLRPETLHHSFQLLMPSVERLRYDFTPDAKQDARRLMDQHLLPTMVRAYAHVVKGVKIASRRERFVPEPPVAYDSAVAEILSVKHPLFERILSTYFKRLRFGSWRLRPLKQWHEKLFSFHFAHLELAPHVKHRRVLRQLVARRHECRTCFQLTLRKIAQPSAANRALVRRWLHEDLRLAALDRHNDNLATEVGRSLTRFPDGPLTSRLVHIKKLGFDWHLRDVMRELKRASRPEHDEVVRQFYAALVVHPRDRFQQTGHPRSPLSYRLTWLTVFFGVNATRAQKKSLPRSLAAWQQWALRQKGAVPAAFVRDLPAMAKNLAHADDKVRFLATVATTALPFGDRLALLRRGLTDKRGSVRAMTALALSWKVRRRADLKQLVPILQGLRKDKNWTVRLVAFNRLAALGDVKLLEPFVDDRSPLVLAGWDRVFEKWPLPRLLKWLDRPDDGAGLVLPTLRRRSLGEKPQWKRPDWARLGKLLQRKSPWLRYRVLIWFRHLTWDELDWTPLFTDPSVLVRYYAIHSLALYAKNHPKSKRYGQHADVLLGDKNLSIVTRAVEALGILKHRAALPQLRKLTGHPACPIRREALKSIASMEGKTVKRLRCVTGALEQY